MKMLRFCLLLVVVVSVKKNSVKNMICENIFQIKINQAPNQNERIWKCGLCIYIYIYIYECVFGWWFWDELQYADRRRTRRKREIQVGPIKQPVNNS